MLCSLPILTYSLENWAGNQIYKASDTKIFTPKDGQQLYNTLKQTTGLIKALGTRHSFSSIADTMHNGTIIRMHQLNKVTECCVDNTVVVQPGITYAALGKYLHEKGYALSNYASLPHISVGGAIMTSTHGSGINNRILADSVVNYEIMLLSSPSTPSSLILRKEDPDFYTALVSVGAIGILTSVTLQIEPQFQVLQCIYPDISWDIILDNGVESFFERAYSVSGFTNWQDPRHLSSVWLKHKQTDTSKIKCPKLMGIESKNYHPLPLRDPSDCSPTGIGPSHVMLPHFLPNNAPSGGGDELQTEYFVAMKDAIGALHALRKIAKELESFVLVSEFRAVAPDNFPLSVCYTKTSKGQPCFGMHFTWINDIQSVTTIIVPLVEKVLKLFKPRPHHGKIHSLTGDEWKKRYEGAKEVKETALKYDPDRRFGNDWLNTYLYRDGPIPAGATEMPFVVLNVPIPIPIPIPEPEKEGKGELQDLAQELQELANSLSEEDAMDQILMDQVDDLLAEENEDADIMASLGDISSYMENSELFLKDDESYRAVDEDNGEYMEL